MMKSVLRMLAVLLAALGLCFAAYAQTPRMGPDQSPATNPIDSDYARQQQQRQLVQPLNNQPLWSEARSGSPQFTSIPGRETNVLIQSQGQTWRAVRTPLVTLGGVIIAMAIVGLAVFYLLRGTLDYEPRPGDRVIERFRPIDRYAHWFLAIVWVTCAITGLILSLYNLQSTAIRCGLPLLLLVSHVGSPGDRANSMTFSGYGLRAEGLLRAMGLPYQVVEDGERIETRIADMVRAAQSAKLPGCLLFTGEFTVFTGGWT